MSNYFISYGIDILIFLGVFYWFRILNHDYKSIIFMSIIYLVINVGFKIQSNDLGLKSNTLLFTFVLMSNLVISFQLLQKPRDRLNAKSISHTFSSKAQSKHSILIKVCI